MGSGVSTNFGFRKPEVMNVDPVEEVDKRTHTFSRAMFKKLEWEVMKAFCQKYKIKQAHLIVVFQRYLTHDEVYIREFKVRTKDPKMLYLRESRLQQVYLIAWWK
jgi:endonuclease III